MGTLISCCFNNLIRAESENFVTSDDVLHFDGQLSLENNGGFAMFRGYIGEKCSGYDQVEFVARTDSPERKYKALVGTGGKGGGFYESEIQLEEDYGSYIIDIKDMTYQFMGWSMSELKGPSGDKVRTI